MKGWVWCLILLSLGGKLIGHFLPRSDKSPLATPLRFLLSLCLVFVLFLPWVRLLRSEPQLTASLDSLFSSTVEMDGDKLILEKMGKTMKKSVDTAFPHSEFSLEIYTNEKNVPILVKVVGADPIEGQKIADFIQRNYGLETATE